MASPAPRPETIEKLIGAVYPSFAMLAGMQLEVFTPLKDGPLSAAHLAQALGVPPAKLSRLLYALVVAGLLTVDGDRFANTPEANEFLVRGRPALPRWDARRPRVAVARRPANGRDDTHRLAASQAGLCGHAARTVGSHVSWDSRRSRHRRTRDRSTV